MQALSPGAEKPGFLTWTSADSMIPASFVQQHDKGEPQHKSQY
jgi:hypothetical protein